jgi:hypothetical protein
MVVGVGTLVAVEGGVGVAFGASGAAGSLEPQAAMRRARRHPSRPPARNVVMASVSRKAAGGRI